MELLDLTDKEKLILENIKYTDEDNSYQILLGLIAMDLLKKPIKRKIEYADLCALIDENQDKYFNFGPVALLGLIDTWIRTSMTYKDKGLVGEAAKSKKSIETNIEAILYGFSEVICEIYHGSVRKKQVEIRKMYQDVNESIKKEQGKELIEIPTETFRFILTCLNYMNFTRINNKSPIYVDVSEIDYDEIS